MHPSNDDFIQNCDNKEGHPSKDIITSAQSYLHPNKVENGESITIGMTQVLRVNCIFDDVNIVGTDSNDISSTGITEKVSRNLRGSRVLGSDLTTSNNIINATLEGKNSIKKVNVHNIT